MSEENDNMELSKSDGKFLPITAIKMQVNLILTKKYGNWKQAVDALSGLYVGEDNIEEVQGITKNVRSFLSLIEENRKAMKEPFIVQGRIIDDAHKEIALSISQALCNIQLRLDDVAKRKQQKAEEERRERERLAKIDTDIDQFILDSSVKIASATTMEQLIAIERLINLEKANKSKYGIKLPILIERCNELNEKVKEQKELIKEREKIEKEKEEAQKAGDDEKLAELMGLEEYLDDKIAENTVLVQEMAASNISSSENTDEGSIDSPKARRTTWKAEIFDVKVVIKKSAEMLDISLNAEKVRQSIHTLKAAGVFAGKEEVIVNGIRYYQEKTF